MTDPIAPDTHQAPRPWAMDALALLFARMDADYQRAAQRHGFVCRGCPDNCCRTRFYHHTLAEYLYLRQGLATLPEADRRRVAERAARAVAEMKTTGQAPPAQAVLCPLNEQERCLLYAHRPMICRLHGIPHRLRRPDGRCQTGPGCGDFDRQCGAGAAPILDRTPLYTALADLERQLRRRLGYAGKIRMTIAQMIAERPVLPDDGGSA